MKITVTPNHRSKIKALRDELTAELQKLLKSNREFSSLSQRQDALTAEIAGLEKSANYKSSEEVQALGLKRIELEHVTAKLSQIPILGVEQTDPIIGLLRQTGYEVTSVLASTLDDYVAPIAKLIRPFCPNDSYAMGLARQTPAAMSLAQMCSRQFGSFGFSLRIVQEAVSRCDEVLAGELNWKFDHTSG